MEVLKASDNATEGWVSFGPRVLRTDDLEHWEGVVGPSNVFVSRHAAAFMEKTETETIVAPAPAGPVTVELLPTVTRG